MLKTVCIVALLATASPGLAQTGDSDPGVVHKAKKPKVVCRRDETTGTRLPGPSTCHTQEDWAKIDKINEEASRKAVDNQRGLQRTVPSARPM
jgi:hypothetical protein